MGRRQSCKDHREDCLSKREQHVLRPEAKKKANIGQELWVSRRAVGEAVGETSRG